MNMHEKKCKNCGANITFSNADTAKCDYCDTVYHIEDIMNDITQIDYTSSITLNKNEENNETKSFATTILLTCVNYAPKNYCFAICGDSLETMDNKFYPNAAQRFKIPPEEHIYYILDCSILGGCRKGFAIGYNGIYYRSEQKITGFMSWNSFKNSTLKLTGIGTVCINELEFIISNKSYINLLQQIQAVVQKFV